MDYKCASSKECKNFRRVWNWNSLHRSVGRRTHLHHTQKTSLYLSVYNMVYVRMYVGGGLYVCMFVNLTTHDSCCLTRPPWFHHLPYLIPFKWKWTQTDYPGERYSRYSPPPPLHIPDIISRAADFWQTDDERASVAPCSQQLNWSW